MTVQIQKKAEVRELRVCFNGAEAGQTGFN